jgi:FlgO protein
MNSRYIGYVLGGAITVLLTSCASTNNQQLDRCSLSRADIYSRIDTRKVIDEVVRGLCQPSGQSVDISQLPAEDAVLIPDVVDVQNLRPESLGLALGELFRSSVSNICRLPIRQVDLSRDLKLNREGTVALTREASLAKQQEFKAQNAYIVTYNPQPTKLTLVARNVALDTATIVGVSTKEVSWTCTTTPSGGTNFSWKMD